MRIKLFLIYVLYEQQKEGPPKLYCICACVVLACMKFRSPPPTLDSPVCNLKPIKIRLLKGGLRVGILGCSKAVKVLAISAWVNISRFCLFQAPAVGIVEANISFEFTPCGTGVKRMLQIDYKWNI